MKKQLSRTEERERTARFLNTLDAEELWSKFGISRVSEIDGFDEIGVPVWTSTRPLSSSISINSGKARTPMMARAGAVAEAIEFCYAEDPKPIQKARTIGQMHLWKDFTVVEPGRWHLAKSAVITNLSVFDWDVVSAIQSLDRLTFLFPSEGVYINHMNLTHLMRLQSSTNGWATGASMEDAVLQGLYEVIERDAWTIWTTLVEGRGVWPPRIGLEDIADWPWLAEIVDRLEVMLIKPVLFDISTDTLVPVAWVLLYDLSNNSAGLFNGFGCAGSQMGAIKRALLEAIQSRACYIAGARDDMLRRNFMLMKHINQTVAYSAIMTVPVSAPLILGPEGDYTASEELTRILDRLKDAGFIEFYVRDAGAPYPCLHVAKVIAPCLEQYKCGYWAPTQRLFNYMERYAPR